MDLLSDLLDLVRARCTLAGRFVAGGSWVRRFDQLDAVKLCAAAGGACWFFMEGMAAPARFERGDVLVTNGSASLILASEPRLVEHARATPLARDDNGDYRIGHGADFMMLGGMVRIDARHQRLLRGGLPPVIHVSGARREAASLAWLLEQMVLEMTPPARPGWSGVLTELAQLLFVQTLRAYVMQSPDSDGGWLRALGDRRLAPAIACMHADPGRAWRLDELAQQAGMSRTSFAVHFREAMGVPPLAYLTHWRMHLAERALRAGASVAQAAEAIGYTSESAFSHAFKRTTGIAPGRCRRAIDEESLLSWPDMAESEAATEL
ncbi:MULTISPECIES: AraC family transcriptional regulator [Burkholderiaceae]|uniref:AraC family transcriptional regulator n=1 Tax=Burkholderiaceae TaxID=119060 RepID=UPI00141FEB8E|nr:MULTISPECIES: AraC family transcriptional regulator [Burkholderiaceae]MBN3846817.1 AraC family transcriptional regulator [Paraburkholderia sp. Ac-20342]NIF51176.1 AraC family transcriptional regulator [Burkholderia sp. Ax-1724]NIF76001.1 AraC family transcriptional regulator [Paraburkholderia sp. Cy-641]